MWLYRVTAHEVVRNDGVVLTNDCYSGFGPDKNNINSERKAGLGPIPRGLYRIGELSDDPSHGPLAMHLWPLHDTDTFGRTGFLWHGDKISAPGAASHGCIVSGHTERQEVHESEDRLLEVAT